MKAKTLSIKNFKNLIEATLDFDEQDSMVVISGNNGAGKSSIVQALFLSIAGKTSLGRGKDVTDVIRHGADKAEIAVTLKDSKRELKVKYSVKASGKEDVEIWASDGGKVSRADLNAMLSEYTIDPLWFSQLKPTERYNEICRISGVDLSKEKAELEKAKIELSNASAILKSVGVEPLWTEQVPTPVDTVALTKELTEATQNNDKAKAIATRMEQAKVAIEKFDQEIAALQARRANAVAALQEKPLSIIDTTGIIEKINSANEKNKAYNNYTSYIDRSNKRNALVKNEMEARENVKKIQEAFRKKVADAQLPVQSMRLDESGELYVGDTRFDLLNTAERIKISVRIAAASNPELKIISVEDGSRLDDNGMKVLEEIADELGFQVFVERVGEQPADSIVIREGKIVTK